MLKFYRKGAKFFAKTQSLCDFAIFLGVFAVKYLAE
jgi:hypothetical protein